MSSDLPTLLAAIEGSNLSEVKRILDAGTVDLDHYCIDNCVDDVPLLLACARGHIDLVKLLLDHGSSVQVTDGMGTTPLTMAAAENRVVVMQVLVDRGARVNYQGREGLTALHIAALNNRHEAIRFLLDHGADRGMKDNSGRTAANWEGYPKIVTDATIQMVLNYVPRASTADL